MFNKEETVVDLYGEHASKLKWQHGRLVLKNSPVEISSGFHLIPGYSRYYINEDGVVYDRISGTTLHPNISGINYPYHSLQRDGVSRLNTVDVHLILALAFMPPPDSSEVLEVNHIDNDRKNYRLDNLEWVTKTENMMHGREYRLANGRFESTDSRIFLIRSSGKPTLVAMTAVELQYIVNMGNSQVYRRLHEIRERGVCKFTHREFEIEVVDLDRYRFSDDHPVVVEDTINGRRMFYGTVTEAANAIGFSRPGVTDLLHGVQGSKRKIIWGYQLFGVHEIPLTSRQLLDYERAYHLMMRESRNKKANNGVGYILVDKLKKIAYPWASRRTLSDKFRNRKYVYSYLGDIALDRVIDDRFDLVPIYADRNSSTITDKLKRVSKYDKMEVSMDIPEYFD